MSDVATDIDSEEPEPPEGVLRDAAKARKKNRWKDAEGLYRIHLAANPKDADAMCWLALCLWRQSDLDGAIEYYERGAALEPTWSGVHNCLGSLYASKKDTGRALAEYEKAIELAPRYPDAHANLGELLWSLNRYDEAAVHLRHAVNAKPDWAEMYETLGHLLIAQDHLGEAQMAMREAIRQQPDRTTAHAGLATVLSKLGRHEDAEAELTLALDANPNDAMLWSQLGWQRWGAKNYADAKNAAEAAAMRNPELPYPQFLLAEIAAKDGDTERAIELYQHYLQLDPDDREGAGLLLSKLGAVAVPEKAPAAYIKQLYAKRATFWDEVPAEKPYRGHLMVAEALERFVGEVTDLKVMDAGCGTGLCAPFLRPLARTLDGVDLSAQMLEKARARGLYDSLIEDDLVSVLRSRAGQYDLIASAATLIHFGDLGPPLEAIATAVRPEGWVVFTVFPFEGDGFGMLSFYCHGHSKPHIRARADAAGFDVISIEEDIHEYQPSGPMNAFAVVLRRR